MNNCPRCGGYHYFENEEQQCLDYWVAALPSGTAYIEIEDTDISNPPDWVQELEFPPVYYKVNDPNYSRNLPK